jgi:hypothetical protein
MEITIVFSEISIYLRGWDLHFFGPARDARFDAPLERLHLSYEPQAA